MKILLAGKPFTGKSETAAILEQKFKMKIAGVTNLGTMDARLFKSGYDTQISSYISEHEIKKSDVILLHPDEIEAVMRHFPDEYFFVGYITVEDENSRKTFAVKTPEDEKRWNEINKLTENAYNNFEIKLENMDKTMFLPDNGGNFVEKFVWEYSEDEAEDLAATIVKTKEVSEKALEALRFLVKYHFIEGNWVKDIFIAEDKTEVPLQDYALQVSYDKTHFGDLMMVYLYAKKAVNAQTGDGE